LENHSHRTNPQFPTAVFLAAILCFSGPSASATEIAGQVVSIIDGDTIDVLYKKRPQRIRLQGIDCPEKGQPYATKAKQATAALVFRKEVTVRLQEDHDRYKRSIGDVVLSDGRILNQELVKDGWCWWYRKYAPNDTELEALETEAREARKGLWSDPAPIPPWIYRKARQKKKSNVLDLVPVR